MSSSTPVGHSDIVKMEYVIGYGLFDTGMNDTLAWTESYRDGISLSEVHWSFVNTGTQKGNEITGKISFTLHDIAGGLFEKYMHMKTGIDYIYFLGPNSDGSLWSGLPALFMVEPDGCSMEFSQTQGFTYTIAGVSAFAVARSNQVVVPSKLNLTNVLQGTDKTFKDIIEKELTTLWNEKLKSCKKPTASIKIVLNDDDDENLFYSNRLPQTNDTKKDGAKGGTFQYTIEQNTNISDAITGLWHNIFEDEDDVQNWNVRVRVDFESWKGTEITVRVKFTDKDTEKVLNNPLKICVGDDKNCLGAEYRGELASVNLNDIANKFLIHKEVKPKEAGNTAPKGTDTSPPPSCPSNERQHDNDYGNVATSEMPWKPSGFFTGGENGRTNYWSQMHQLIQDNNATPLEIEINMPYTAAFTPTPHTSAGKLKSGMDSMVSSIHLTQGAELEFWWYDSVHCDKLVKSPIISSTYRISEVSHQIGLSGNQTVVKLSHLQLGE